MSPPPQTSPGDDERLLEGRGLVAAYVMQLVFEDIFAGRRAVDGQRQRQHKLLNLGAAGLDEFGEILLPRENFAVGGLHHEIDRDAKIIGLSIGFPSIADRLYIGDELFARLERAGRAFGVIAVQFRRGADKDRATLRQRLCCLSG